MLLPPFEPHWQARTGCSQFRTLSPTSRPASMNRWCFLARTRPPSRISILAARPPLAAWSCKPNSGTLIPGLNAMGSCSQRIAGRFTASGQTIVMGKRRSCRQNGPSYDDRDACLSGLLTSTAIFRASTTRILLRRHYQTEPGCPLTTGPG